MANRWVCAMLDEMRKLHECRNYSGLLGLIEEVQTAVNRMEAALQDQKDIEWKHKELRRLKKEIKELEKQKDSDES
jgi:uncharacterized protein Yka (UPF0111/DUF47 family)